MKKPEINILLLSCGTRNKLIQYFKIELKGKGKIFAADSSRLAPALYEADKHFIIPKFSEDNYIDTLLNICEENNITAILSLIDPELSVIAKNKQRFLDIGTTPIISELSVIELSLNKFHMYNFLKENKFPTPQSFIDKDLFYENLDKGNISYPVFLKPVSGSASTQISKVNSNEELEMLFESSNGLMIQEYMNGKEFGVDVYVDMKSNKVTSIFIKEKLKMRAGETDKSVSIKDDNLKELIIDFVEIVGYKGIIDIDVFMVDGKFYISEVNPRFGGGYPHAYECGVNIPKMILNNLEGRTNKASIYSYQTGIYMMKFNDVKIFKF